MDGYGGYKSISRDTLDCVGDEVQQTGDEGPTQSAQHIMPYPQATDIWPLEGPPESDQEARIDDQGILNTESIYVEIGNNNNDNYKDGHLQHYIISIAQSRPQAAGKWHTVPVKAPVSIIEKVIIIVLLGMIMALSIVAGTLSYVDGLVPSLSCVLVLLFMALLFILFRNRQPIRLCIAKLLRRLATKVEYQQMDEA